MGFYYTLIILIALIALLLSVVVLLQSGKGGGLAGIAAGQTQQVLGARQAPDLLEKASWILATIFIALCILTNFVNTTGGPTESIIQSQPLEQTAPPISDTPPAAPPAGDQGGTDENADGNEGQ